MNAFPLAPFLASLASDGIRLTLRDYERITLALHNAGNWTISRLRDVLLALLAKDQAQQEIRFVVAPSGACSSMSQSA